MLFITYSVCISQLSHILWGSIWNVQVVVWCDWPLPWEISFLSDGDEARCSENLRKREQRSTRASKLSITPHSNPLVPDPGFVQSEQMCEKDECPHIIHWGDKLIFDYNLFYMWLYWNTHCIAHRTRGQRPVAPSRACRPLVVSWSKYPSQRRV